ncbi:MAG: efflux RND transporter permease subunit, partial [Pirellulales bacterium]
IIAHGAGAEMRNALGVAVFSGMLGVTMFGLVLTPVFFYAIDWLGTSRPFAASWLQKFNFAVLGTLSLRPARWLGRQLIERLAAASRRERPAPLPSLIEQAVQPPPDTVVAIVEETLEVPGIVHEVTPHRPAFRPHLLKRTK